MRLASPSSLTIFLLALGPGTAFADNFVSSCDAGSVKVSGRTLTASCRNILGQLKCSRLDLNRCIKNTYGSLQADPNASGYVPISSQIYTFLFENPPKKL